MNIFLQMASHDVARTLLTCPCHVGSVDSYLYALDSTTGKLAWKFRTNAAVYSSPAIGTDGLVYVGSTDWRQGRGDLPHWFSPSPFPRFQRLDFATAAS